MTVISQLLPGSRTRARSSVSPGPQPVATCGVTHPAWGKDRVRTPICSQSTFVYAAVDRIVDQLVQPAARYDRAQDFLALLFRSKNRPVIKTFCFQNLLFVGCQFGFSCLSSKINLLTASSLCDFAAVAQCRHCTGIGFQSWDSSPPGGLSVRSAGFR